MREREKRNSYVLCGVSFQFLTQRSARTRDLAEQCINTGTRCIMHACALAFLEHGTMGVSSNQRPIRVVHASHGLPNAIFNRNYDTLYTYVHAGAHLSLLSPRRMSEELITRFPRPIPTQSSYFALNKRDSSQGQKVHVKFKRSTWQKNKLFTRCNIKIMYARRERRFFGVKLNKEEPYYLCTTLKAAWYFTDESVSPPCA